MSESDAVPDGQANNGTPSLRVLLEKAIPYATNTELTALCDPYDLVAVVCSATQDVQVFRIDGQVAYTIKQRIPEVHVTALHFKPDGSVLAVGHADGICTLHAAENGRFLSQVSVLRNTAKDDWKLDLAPDYAVDDELLVTDAWVNCISWCTHQPGVPDAASSWSFTENRPPMSTEEWADMIMDSGNESGKFKDQASSGIERVTDELTKLDVTRILPKLSPIPAHGVRQGSGGNLFSTMAALHNIFDAGNEEKSATAGSVDILIVAATHGGATVFLDDTVKIGETQLDVFPEMRCSHQHSHSHAFLIDADAKGGVVSDEESDENGGSNGHSENNPDAVMVGGGEGNNRGNLDGAIGGLLEHDSNSRERFSMHYVDLPLRTLGGPLLHVISTNTKRIQNLLTYITHTIRCIEYDWTTGLQFPKRVIKNITEELAEKQEGDLVTNLYHLAMTGAFSKTMEEWLTDILKETNHKRWDQAIGSMYTHIQNHLCANLLPALDRLEIATTTLRGQARFHLGTSKFDVAPQLFTNMLEGIDSLRLVAQKTQLRIMTEHRQFTAFSKWLRVMIDVGVGRNTASSLETEEREVPNLDYGLLLAYIKDTLGSSQLEYHVGPIAPGEDCNREQFFANPLVRSITYDNTTDALEQLDAQKLPESLRHLVNMSAIAVCLNGHARFAMDSITTWQSKMIPQVARSCPVIPHMTSHERIKILDTRMWMSTAYPKYVWPNVTDCFVDVLLRTAFEDEREKFYRARVRCDENEPDATQSVQGLPSNPETEMLDAKLLDEAHALGLIVDAEERYTLALLDIAAHSSGHPSSMRALHVFPTPSTFKPRHIVVGGRKGKRVCLVMAKDGSAWQFLELEEPSRVLDYEFTHRFGITMKDMPVIP